jgi:hypothetical protein
VSTVNPFEAAREKLGPSGEHWFKGGAGDDRHFCLAIALHQAHPAGWNTTSILLGQIIARCFPERTPDELNSIADFNDDERTSWEDIALVLKEAAALW